MESKRLWLIIILSMLAGIGIMRNMDIIFGFRSAPCRCKYEQLKKINAQLEQIFGSEDEKSK